MADPTAGQTLRAGAVSPVPRLVANAGKSLWPKARPWE
jgi:hypothetical protein